MTVQGPQPEPGRPLYHSPGMCDETCPCWSTNKGPTVEVVRNPEEPDGDVTHAIEVVAMTVLARVVDGNVNWEDYPEIGENDWDLVVERVNGLLGHLHVTHADYVAAYALLESRADDCDR